MLRTALGPSIAGWLDDPAVIEVMLNPDGRLWVDRLGEGISDTGMTLGTADGDLRPARSDFALGGNDSRVPQQNGRGKRRREGRRPGKLVAKKHQIVPSRGIRRPIWRKQRLNRCGVHPAQRHQSIDKIAAAFRLRDPVRLRRGKVGCCRGDLDRSNIAQGEPGAADPQFGFA